jgi:hypothetical protein
VSTRGLVRWNDPQVAPSPHSMFFDICQERVGRVAFVQTWTLVTIAMKLSDAWNWPHALPIQNPPNAGIGWRIAMRCWPRNWRHPKPDARRCFECRCSNSRFSSSNPGHGQGRPPSLAASSFGLIEAAGTGYRLTRFKFSPPHRLPTQPSTRSTVGPESMRWPGSGAPSSVL